MFSHSIKGLVIIRASKEFVPKIRNLGSGNSPYLIPTAGKPSHDKFETTSLKDGSIVVVHKFEQPQSLNERMKIDKVSNHDAKRQKRIFDEIKFDSKEQKDKYMTTGNLAQQQLIEFKTLTEQGSSQKDLAKKFNLPSLIVANIISKNNFRKPRQPVNQKTNEQEIQQKL